MNELTVYEEAVGDCVVCGADSEGSLYWVGMSDERWAVVRPHIESLFEVSPWSGVRLVQKVFFIPLLDRPLCGPECSLRYKEKNDARSTPMEM